MSLQICLWCNRHHSNQESTSWIIASPLEVPPPVHQIVPHRTWPLFLQSVLAELLSVNFCPPAQVWVSLHQYTMGFLIHVKWPRDSGILSLFHRLCHARDKQYVKTSAYHIWKPERSMGNRLDIIQSYMRSLKRNKMLSKMSLQIYLLHTLCSKVYLN